ncbi:MAG: 3-dehydroquinate synthase [Armatimonadetes bacterium]|nr:3-dehydroquinate synthase [Armatimonadota bacterium]
MTTAVSLPMLPPLRPPARAVFLAGFMAAGKSVVGQILADRLGVPFVDTDALIEQKAGQSISQIFETHGEQYFRRLESEALREAIAKGPAIIATGGGIMTVASNVAEMRAAGPIILLSVRPETVVERTQGDKTRPLLGCGDRLARARELLRARKPYYEKADYFVKADDASPEDIAESAMNLLRNDPRGASLVPGIALVEVRPPGAAPYVIAIGDGVLDRADELLAAVLSEQAQIAVVTAQGPCQAIAQRLSELISSRWPTHLVAVPDSEESKSVPQLSRLWREFASAGLDRRSCVVAVGGGMVGDLAATAAATYMRGISIVHVPTTVLSQIDSSIGGKAAINLEAGKNLVGAFHHPVLVMTDICALDTLPEEQFRDGLAEGIKHAVLFDAEMAEWLASNMQGLLGRERIALRYFIARNVQLKAAIVNQDPEEQHLRALLNFGHTIGHALERGAEEWGLSHGRAVAIGMAAEVQAAVDMGFTPQHVRDRVIALLRAAALPTGPVRADLKKAEAAMLVDKKKAGRALKWPVLSEVGRSCLVALPDVTALLPYLRLCVTRAGRAGD